MKNKTLFLISAVFLFLLLITAGCTGSSGSAVSDPSSSGPDDLQDALSADEYAVKPIDASVLSALLPEAQGSWKLVSKEAENDHDGEILWSWAQNTYLESKTNAVARIGIQDTRCGIVGYADGWNDYFEFSNPQVSMKKIVLVSGADCWLIEDHETDSLLQILKVGSLYVYIEISDSTVSYKTDEFRQLFNTMIDYAEIKELIEESQ